jgi:uncharacterized membrane protein YbhN (UPF0104 family)
LLALVVAVQMTVGWGPLLAPWRALSIPLLGLLFSLSALSYGLRAVRVDAYFYPRFAGCFPTVLRLSVLHNVANNLLPMRAGEMVFPWLMRRYFGHGVIDATGALLWIRALDLHCLVLIGLFIAYLRGPSWIWWVLGCLWVAALLVVAPLGRHVSALSRERRSGLLGSLRHLILRLLGAAPREPLVIARVYGWTLLIWALKFTAFAVLLQHFLPVEFWQVLVGVMGAELSSVLPFHGIAGSGSYEIAIVAALAPLGVDPARALVGAVNLHLFLLGTTLILGGLAFLLPRDSVCGTAAASPSEAPETPHRPRV